MMLEGESQKRDWYLTELGQRLPSTWENLSCKAEGGEYRLFRIVYERSPKETS